MYKPTMSNSIITRIGELGVFPIVVLDDSSTAEPIGEALMAGGLPIVEVTLRTPAAAEAIKIFSSRFPEMLVGAGTVLSKEQVDIAADAGAEFILSPGFNPVVVDYCLEKGLTIFPGICTPSEIDACLIKGLEVLKFFPSEAMGGVEYLKAVSAPLAGARYLPTGGLTLQNLPDYLAFEKTHACAGTWIAKKDRIAAGEFELIQKDAAAACAVVRQVRGEK
jgi:2-dehydro-3-deoxyphosphogluconate aldolase / (4S)-4-hydroxy-2-oxoglutarate aldolase